MKELHVEALVDNLNEVLGAAEIFLEESGCPLRDQMKVTVAVEEMYVNIAHYAYSPNVGDATIIMEKIDDPNGVCFTFIDEGVPFDPLAKPDPDLDVPLEERKIGGLGIYMVKKSMDDVAYERKDGKNIFKMRKYF